ncbi:hypothetical protein SAY87_005878 [Trapa incisa]|uniref:pectinesterase n=1 Tax=Trapa incisa TaxID=236973 RepID=A0AAN7QCF4_9MYRT|nr:hypothetical protein SAY87_005878 [Trapa incisa]
MPPTLPFSCLFLCSLPLSASVSDQTLTRTQLHLTMASALLFISLLAVLSSSAAVAYRLHRPHFVHRGNPSLALTPPEIAQACKATRFQDTCSSSLTRSMASLPPKPGPLAIIETAMRVSSENLATAESMARSILESSAGHLNRTSHAKNCLQALLLSQHRIKVTSEALQHGRTKDARAFMGAALQYQYDCWSELSYSNETSLVGRTMSFLDNLMWLTSNALCMINSYDIYGPDTSSWRPPATERAGFWEPRSRGSVGSSFGSRGGFPMKVAPNVTVCKAGEGACSYRTVQAAVDAAPNNGEKKFVIHIKEGVYEEIVRVPLEKKNVVFLGDGVGKTIITGSLSVARPGLFTYNTATVGVLGDGFMASGITFQNTAGPDVHQAVAFRSDSDLSIIENCEFLGNQDTLYVHSLRQFYKSCRIEGNVDFIFGNAAAFFQDCVILVRPRQLNPEKGENNAITAQGRTDPAQSTGLVFENCVINGTERYMELCHSNQKVHRNFLGRPWKEYSRTVFIHCYMDALISEDGWMPFREGFALDTLYYGEFGNSGPGSSLSGRVSWSSKIPAKRVSMYSVQNFIQGNEWIPVSS